MTLPTRSDVHVNVPLTNMSVAYMQDLAKFQADNLAPIMPSDKQSNLFFKFTKDFWFRDEMRQRGVGAPAVRVGYGITTDSFATDLWAVGKPIDDQVRANEDTPLNSDRNAMQLISRLERLRREKAFAAACFGTGKWATDITGVSGSPSAGQVKQWDQANSTPLEDIAAQIEAMELLTGFTPNVLAIGEQVWKILKNHAEILARITGGASTITPAQITKQLVAGLFEIDELVVLRAVENTALEGAAFTGAYVFGKHALLMYRDPGASVESVTAARTFTWQQYAGNRNGTRILKWRDESVHSDVVEIESAFVHKIIASDLGIFINGVVG